MKIERSYPKCIISAKGADWVSAGHPWVYEGEVVQVSVNEAIFPPPSGTL